MYTVGKILQKMRKHLNLTYKDVTNAIHIKPEYLKKLEQNDFTGFKSTTFVKGFIRSYASFLGLDVDKVMALYRRQVGEEEEPIKTDNKPVSHRSIVLSPLHLAFVGLIIFFLVAVFYMFKLYVQAQQPPKLRIIAPKQEHQVVKTPEFEIKGVTEARVLVKINDKEIQLNPDNTFSLKLSLQKGENIITVEAYKIHLPDKKSVKHLVIEYKPEEDTKKKKKDVKKNTVPQGRFVVETTGPAWLQIVVDNIQLDVGIKDKGYKKEFTAKKEVIIKSGVPSRTKVYLDGKPLELSPQNALKEGWRCVLENDKWGCK